MTDDQIKHMVDRFLSWRLPENFNPDAGISFTRTFNDHLPQPMKHEPIGTNLFDATQAEQMVRYMIDGLPDSGPSSGGDANRQEPVGAPDYTLKLAESALRESARCCTNLVMNHPVVKRYASTLDKELLEQQIFNSMKAALNFGCPGVEISPSVATEEPSGQSTDHLSRSLRPGEEQRPGVAPDELPFMPTTDAAKPTQYMVDEALDGFNTMPDTEGLRAQVEHAVERAMWACPVFAPLSPSVWALVDKWRQRSGEEGLHYVLKNALLNHAIELDEALTRESPSQDAIMGAAWVACSERMPRQGDDVLVFCPPYEDKDNGTINAWVEIANWIRPREKNGGWASRGSDQSRLNVTHWMPLPKAPHLGPVKHDDQGETGGKP